MYMIIKIELGWLLNIRPIDFRSKKFTRDKGYYILIKGLN